MCYIILKVARATESRQFETRSQMLFHAGGAAAPPLFLNTCRALLSRLFFSFKYTNLVTLTALRPLVILRRKRRENLIDVSLSLDMTYNSVILSHTPTRRPTKNLILIQSQKRGTSQIFLQKVERFFVEIIYFLSFGLFGVLRKIFHKFNFIFINWLFFHIN